ncbi:MAG: DUF898 family protein [Pseudomonadota bacterium]
MSTDSGSGPSNPWKSVPSTGQRPEPDLAAAAAQVLEQPATGPARTDTEGRVVFDAGKGVLVPLAIKGYLLTLVTLGIYRFWYITDLRRFFWGHTLVHGSSLEYIGRGLEIFLGFLIALAIIVPLNAIVLGVSIGLNPELAPFASIALSLVFGFLFLFAYYRARRYRLNRTVWRGLRVHQTGSGWGYAVRAAGWIVLGILTLGLSVPFAEADLYRYRIARMHLGAAPFSFYGSWRSIAVPYGILWAIFILPLALVTLTALFTVDFVAFAGAWVPTGDGNFRLDTTKLGPGDAGVIAAFASSVGWTVFGLFVSYPYYYARRTSQFFSATALQGVKTEMRLKARSLYGAYLLFFLLVALAGIVVPLVFGIIAGILYFFIGLASLPEGSQTVVTLITSLIGIYGFLVVVGILGLIYLQRRIWELVAGSIFILNPELLDDLVGRLQDSEGGFGAGFADAMDVGDFDIGL